MLTSEQLWTLWQTSFFWDEWQSLGDDVRTLAVDDELWRIKRNFMHNRAEIALFHDTQEIVKLIRIQEVKALHRARVEVAFEVWVYGQCLQRSAALHFREVPIFKEHTLYVLYAVLPTFITEKL